VKVIALKALVWKASRKCASNVIMILRVNICLSPGRLCGRGSGGARERIGLDGADQGPTLPSRYKESSSFARVNGL
jgi:hypothetical protein